MYILKTRVQIWNELKNLIFMYEDTQFIQKNPKCNNNISPALMQFM